MTSMTPRQFEGFIHHLLGGRRIEEWRSQLVEDYRWAYGAAHSQSRRGTGGGHAQGHSDPTGVVTVGQVAEAEEAHPNDDRTGPHANLRRVLERVTRKVAQLESEMNSIDTILVSAMDRLDPKESLDETWDGRKPSPLEREDLRRAAQRRRARGEHVP